MAREKAYRKTPSRKRYEEQHPTISLRLDLEDSKCFKEHLSAAGCSPADFVKQHLRKEQSMIEKRVEMLASRQADPSLEERVRCLEDLAHTLVCFALDCRKFPPYCPRCEDQKLLLCEGREMDSNIVYPWVPTWKCPKCGYFINTFKRIDPESVTWIEPDAEDPHNKRKNVRSPHTNKRE